MKEFVIIANGPFFVEEIIREAIQGKTIIALDGAANKLAKLRITPHVILGDFDSVKESTSFWGIKKTFGDMKEDDKPYQGNNNVTIVPAKDQNKTDLSKAIDYCDEQSATHITILCASGGREDHHQATTGSLRKHYKKDRPIILFSEQQLVRFAKDETLTIHGNIGDHCGIIAAVHGSATSSGLQYEMENYTLEFGHSDSTSNALATTEATIKITGEALIIMPTTLPAHRRYLSLTELEQAELKVLNLRKYSKKLAT